jgi:undecaprenyl-diphosphatase
MAIVIGLAQCVALIPGVSRSGSTVVAALWLGVAPLEAAAFSFLMSIPAIAGAAVLKLPDISDGGTALSGGALAVGFLAAGVVGILSIRVFVRMLRDRSFPVFAWYCWGVGLIFLGWLLSV